MTNNYEIVQTIREANSDTCKRDTYDVTAMEYALEVTTDPSSVKLPAGLCIIGQHVYEIGRKVCRIEAAEAAV